MGNRCTWFINLLLELGTPLHTSHPRCMFVKHAVEIRLVERLFLIARCDSLPDELTWVFAFGSLYQI